MNHDEVGAYAAERYLLDEMPEPERDAFEGHYFDCMVCANDVRSAYAFNDSVRAVARCENEVAAHRAARGWRRFTAPLAAAASVAVVMMGWMQFGVVDPLKSAVEEARQPRVLSSYRLESNRGDERAQVPDSRTAFELEVFVPPDASAKYACHIIDAHGVTRYTLSATAAQAENYVRIGIPSGTLQPGQYTLRVDGKAPKIAEYPFTVR